MTPTSTRGGAVSLVVALITAACTDGPSRILTSADSYASAVKFWEAGATTRWNDRATALLVLRPPANGQAAASRVLTYLSIAQYRAALAAEQSKDKSDHPSVSAAVGGASAAILGFFFPLDVATIEAQLDGDLAAPQWPGAVHENPVAGETVGRAVAATVLTQVATDNYNVVSPGNPPVGPGLWIWNGQPIVRGLYRTRPFFLTSQDQLRPPPPPPFGSATFLAALAQVRQISDTRTAEQLQIAQFWNTSTGPFTMGAHNRTAVGLLKEHHRTEVEAARILAYANAAAFDAGIACFDAKYAYWYIRPSHADPAITLPIGLPNHPSYPSGHSCITSAFMTALAKFLPSETPQLEHIITQAGLSRIYGGIHYSFDITAGRDLGRGAAALALAGKLE
jgi:membrane-associated phospholipid phosphatase